MNDNEPKSVADLLADESFLLYCTGNEKETENWQQQFLLVPGLRETAAEAKRLYGLMSAEKADAGAAAKNFAGLLQPRRTAESIDTGGRVKPLLLRPWVWAAAAVILLLATVGGKRLFMSVTVESTLSEAPVSKAPSVQTDPAPGKNSATLVLADGSSVLLDSAAAGQIASQNGIRIIKLPDDQIRYQQEGQADGPVGYNSIQTPNGGQYRLVLPDGTGVWLNAASSLRYPTRFTGNERRVSVTGEVYFEVTKMPARPFVVEKDGMEIRVLGTHFNVNSYTDEPDLRVTLLEGSVTVNSMHEATARALTLRPGQQARLTGNGQLQLTSDIDVEEVMAWKNGLFDFSNADIQTIMRQIARWYNLSVVFQGSIPQREFSGKITRSTNLSNVLKILEQSNIHFEVENRTIVVKP